MAYPDVLKFESWWKSPTRRNAGPTPVGVGPDRLDCGLGGVRLSIARGYEVQLKQDGLLDIGHRRNTGDVQVKVGSGHADG